MASTHLSRLRRLRLPVLFASVALAAAVVPGVSGSAAASPALTLHQAQAKVAALNAQAEKITESFDAARVTLGTVQKQEKASAASLAHDQRVLAALQRRVGASAAAAYRSGGLSATTSLVSTGNAQTFLDQTSGLDEVAQYQANQVAQATAEQRQVAAATALHNAQVKHAQALVSTIGSKNKQVQSLLAQAKSVLARLTAAQQARLAAEQAAQHRRAVAERSTYHPPSAPKSTGGTYNGPASGQAGEAVKFAYAQLGKPYVYGASGPSSYDCSGLTMRAWGAAGVGLPHNAAMQQSEVHSVSISDLEPGDLVFFGDPAFHVAIYIGGGNIIQAPHTGADVEITPLSYMPPTSAGRP
ncbi:MAG TPA: NlpC/P60 family protein [Mycobacteriales bacterium]|nr:NlpC/P60 family protein [Mycobacteriales bacterium]